MASCYAHHAKGKKALEGTPVSNELSDLDVTHSEGTNLYHIMALV